MCTATASHFSGGRKRRATDDERTASVTRELRWFDDELLNAGKVLHCEGLWCSTQRYIKTVQNP